MKILIVTAMFPPIRTGTSNYSKNIAETLKDLGHDVTLVTLENELSKKDRYNFPVYRLRATKIPLKNYFKHFRISCIYPGNYSKLYKIAKNCQAEVILLVNHYLDIAFPTIYVAKKLRLPLVVVVATELYSLNPGRDKILNILDKLICGKLIFNHCQKIIALDREIRRYLSDVQGREILAKTVIVPYGPNGEINFYLKYRHDYSHLNQIIGIGSIIEQRNFIFLIHLFKKLLKFYPRLKLKIIGHVYYKVTPKLVEKLNLADKVEFTGEMPHDQVLAELQKSAFYCGMLSGEYAALGTATIEAMLMGVPIVTNVPKNLLGKPRLKDMENFIFTDGVSLEKVFPKLKKLMSNERLRQKIGQNGRKFVQKNLNWENVAQQMAKVLYQEISL